MLTCPTCHLEYHHDETVCAVDGATLEERTDPRVGKLIGGRYQLDSVLGEGGMATVFRAHHTVIHRHVAVKLLHPYMARDKRTCERFAREARSAAAIAHPNVIEIFDFGTTEEGVPYLVMEILEGAALRNLVDRGPMSFGVAFEIGIQLLRGLARAHDLGVHHRDLKPENAFVEVRDDGSIVAKLVDFGIARSRGDARLTDLGAIIGTPQYVAPERLKGTESGVPADLYSFGVMLFEMVTGQLPLHAEGLPAWILVQLEGVPPAPSALRADVPPALDRLILELLAKDPNERPVDARVVIEALEKLRAELGLDAIDARIEPSKIPAETPAPPAPSAEAPSAAPAPDGPPRALGAPPEEPAPREAPQAPDDATNRGDEWLRPTPVPPPPTSESPTAEPAARARTEPPPAPAPASIPMGTQSLTIERWQRRATIIAQMLERAFPAGSAPPELRAHLHDVEKALGRMHALREQRLAEQERLGIIEDAARSSRERLGHAVHELGELLSRARSELRAAEELVEAKKLEVADVDYQIGVLREKLADDETSSFEQREGSDVSLAESGEELERLRREIGNKTLAVLTAVRNVPAVRPLLVELQGEERP